VVLAVVLCKGVHRLGTLVPEHTVKVPVHVIGVKKLFEGHDAAVLGDVLRELLGRVCVHALESLHLLVANYLPQYFWDTFMKCTA